MITTPLDLRGCNCLSLIEISNTSDKATEIFEWRKKEFHLKGFKAQLTWIARIRTRIFCYPPRKRFLINNLNINSNFVEPLNL